MAFSSSRGILYTAPPAETDRTDEQKTADGGTERAAPAPADD